jgi:hypothetical protein
MEAIIRFHPVYHPLLLLLETNLQRKFGKNGKQRFYLLSFVKKRFCYGIAMLATYGTEICNKTFLSIKMINGICFRDRKRFANDFVTQRRIDCFLFTENGNSILPRNDNRFYSFGDYCND